MKNSADLGGSYPASVDNTLLDLQNSSYREMGGGEGLSTEGHLRFKIDWASLIVGRKFTVFALFYFVFEGNFPSTSPRGAYIWRGDLTEGFLRYRFGGLIFGGAYTWRGLFSEFYDILLSLILVGEVGRVNKLY